MTTEKITFRCNVRLKKILIEYAKYNDMKVGAVIRNIIEYFFMGFLTGEFKKSFPELEKDFFKYAKEKS